MEAVTRPPVAAKGITAGLMKIREPVLRYSILFLICGLAVSVRLFAVLRYESVIHEFDPYFNYRVTRHLVKFGMYDFINWFDERVWYPLGRYVGGTVYPGLMATAGFGHWLLNSFLFVVNVRNVCVFLAPFFAALTSLVAYWMGSEVRSPGTGLIAALLMSVVPGYISRSVAGSYDNEAVAIFAMLLTYTLFVKAVKTGSLGWSGIASLAYFYMVAAWGGYIFIINLIPLYTLVMVVIGRFSQRLYVAYNVFYVLGTIMSMQPANIGFLPVLSPEHLASMGIFAFLQVYVFIRWTRSLLNPDQFTQFIRVVGVAVLASVVGLVLFLSVFMTGFSGRALSLLDPSGKHMAIVKSVSEHQPPVWTTFFMDLHIMLIFIPIGMYVLSKQIYGQLPTASEKERTIGDAGIFMVLYGATSVYFASVMIRLVLILAPVASVLAAVGIAACVEQFTALLKAHVARKRVMGIISSGVLLAVLTFLMGAYVVHCGWVSSEAYSSPSIVLAAPQHDGTRMLFDDFREAYYWIRMNTAPEAKIVSWWDYGYQLSAMADRTTIVDNNTWNNTHIAQVGKIMASDEVTARQRMERLDVDYALVVFGGMIGYSSDDINKFLWMVRIAGSVDPTVKESDYMSNRGHYTIDREASPTMLKSLMYKMCYYRFGELLLDYSKPAGFDRVRNVEIGDKSVNLTHLEEAFTSEHWMVRIYRVKPLPNRDVVHQLTPDEIAHQKKLGKKKAKSKSTKGSKKAKKSKTKKAASSTPKSTTSSSSTSKKGKTSKKGE